MVLVRAWHGSMPAVDFNILTSSPEEFIKQLHADIEVFTKVARAAGLRVD